MTNLTAEQEMDNLHDAIVSRDKRIQVLESALVNAALHVEELRDAWERGCIHETDGKGGTRSNRNMDVVLELAAARAALKSEGA